MKPNIIVISTDQQRYDTINGLGFPYMKTPNLDNLVREGTAFTNCYCTAPSCVPSRASFYNGCYPHRLDVYHNFCRWEHSWVELLNKAGYHCVNIGKMHTVPYDAHCGFDERYIVENKDRPLLLDDPHGGFLDELDRFIENSGMQKPSRHTYKNHPEHEKALGAYEWPLEEKYHPDIFVGNMTEWFLKKRESKSPLFLEIGFPGPHPPFDPPSRFVELYEDVDIPVPNVLHQELAAQPKAQTLYRKEMTDSNHDAVKWIENPSDEQLLRMRRYYAANVTLIDEKIGVIMELLKKHGYLENAIVVFMSDHGDCLGDHGHIQKWTMYDSVTHVPMVMWSPGRIEGGQKSDALIQHMDIAATILDMVGIKVPDGWDAKPLEQIKNGREYVFAEHSKDNVLKGVDYITMVRSSNHKLVHYLDQEEGELYDLIKDPGETVNLWHESSYQETRQSLLETLLNWRIRSSVRNQANQSGHYK